MKYRVLFVLLGALLWGACEQEEDIVPRSSKVDFIFDFPQGDNEWDRDLVEIADKFGVQCIYKDLDSMDINRLWVAGTFSSGYRGEGLQDERLLKLYTRFFKEHVFAHLNPEVVKSVFPNYIYFCYNLASHSVWGDMAYMSQTQMMWNGMGFWAFGWETEEMPGFMGTTWKGTMFTDAIDVEKNREIVMKNIYDKLLTAGIVTMPEEFEAGVDGGFDYKTQVVYVAGTEGDDNYYKRRGFPDLFRNLFLYATPSPMWSITYTSPQQNFNDYLWLAFRYTAEEIEEEYKDYPMVIKYYHITVDYMKEKYGMDISEIAEPVTEDLDAGM